MLMNESPLYLFTLTAYEKYLVQLSKTLPLVLRSTKERGKMKEMTHLDPKSSEDCVKSCKLSLYYIYIQKVIVTH